MSEPNAPPEAPDGPRRPDETPDAFRARVIAWCNDNKKLGFGYTTAAKRFGVPGPTIKGWMRGEGAADVPDASPSVDLPTFEEFDGAGPYVLDRVSRAKRQCLDFLAGPHALRDGATAQRMAVVLGILCDKYPEILAAPDDLGQHSADDREAAAERLSRALGLAPGA
jgi:hypothetical protein